MHTMQGCSVTKTMILTVSSFEALQAVSKDLSADELLALVLKTGEINLKCMELLDKANTETYGTQHLFPSQQI